MFSPTGGPRLLHFWPRSGFFPEGRQIFRRQICFRPGRFLRNFSEGCGKFGLSPAPQLPHRHRATDPRLNPRSSCPSFRRKGYHWGDRGGRASCVRRRRQRLARSGAVSRALVPNEGLCLRWCSVERGCRMWRARGAARLWSEGRFCARQADF